MRNHLTLGVLIAVALSACTHVVEYNPAYLKPPVDSRAQKLDGKVLIYTTAADDNYVYKEHPTGFVGALTTLVVPIGQITKHAAESAFAPRFTGGPTSANSLDAIQNYRIVIHPKLVDYSHEFYSLYCLSLFTITPTVRLKVAVSVLGQNKAVVWQRSYGPEEFQGDWYLVSFAASERVNRLTHTALLQIMERAIGDLRVDGILAGEK